jgi:RNA-directed DNA polymerase
MEQRKAQDVAKSVETQPQLRLENTEATLTDLITSRVKKVGEEPLKNIMCLFTKYQLRQAYELIPGSKAKGNDGITKAIYGKNLERNLEDLHQRLLAMTYRPGPARLVLIPKMDGSQRPIAISNFEDKIVQKVMADILSAIYEREFKRHSFGFRPKRSCHSAVGYLYNKLRKHNYRWVVDVDLKSFFNSIDHEHLMELVKHKISDRRFRQYLGRMLKSNILHEGCVQANTLGTPQGSIVSPILANLFLDHVIDDWFETEISPQHGGSLVRYADDFVAAFKTKADARSFVVKLKKRLKEFKLEINKDKTKLICFDRKQKRSGSFNFLGFTFYWGWSRVRESVTLKVKTNNKTLYKKIQEYDHWIKKNRSYLKLRKIWERTGDILRGHFNYFGVSWNLNGLLRFYKGVIRSLFRWLNRRSQRLSYTWVGFKQRLESCSLPLPRRGYKLIELTNARLYCG